MWGKRGMDPKSRAELLRQAFARPLSPWEWFLESLAVLGLLSTWAFLLISWHQIPEQIPTHFGFTGTPDAYGARESILPLVGLQFAFWLGLTLVLRVPPHLLNFPVEITEANADRMALATRVLNRALKTFCVFTFGLLIVQVVTISTGATSQLPGWFLPVVLVLPPLLIAASVLYGLRPSPLTRREGSDEIQPSSDSEGVPTDRQPLRGLIPLVVLLGALFIPIWAVSRWGMAPDQAVAISTGVAMIAAGLSMPFLPPNLMIGIRTRWTLSNQRVWQYTHAWSTFIWVPGGILLLTLGLLNWRPLVAVFLIPATAAGASVLASYLAWRRTARQ